MIRGSAFALGFLSLAVFAAWPASAATGDWTQYGFTAQGRRENTQETVLTRTSVAHLTLKWSANIKVMLSSAAVANGIVYVGAADGNLYAFDARTGAPIWKAATGDRIYSSPAVADGLVFVGSNDKHVYAFDAETGAVRWATPTDNQVWSPITVANGLVYAGTIDGTALAINARTGVVKWTAMNIGPGGITAAPAVAHGIAYFASLSGKFGALDARTGAVLWQQSIRGYSFGAPAVDRDTVFVNSASDIGAFDTKTGTQRWLSELSGINTLQASIAIGRGHVYAGTEDFTLWNFNEASGQLVYSSLTGGQLATTPALANGVLYFGSIAYDARSSKLLWQDWSANMVIAAPTVSNGMLYVGGGNQFSAYGLPEAHAMGTK